MSTAATHPDALLASPALRLLPTTIPPGPVDRRRPDLWVIEGGRSRVGRARQATYRRRRIAALVGLLVAVALTFLLADAIGARLADDGTPSTVVGVHSPASADASSAAGAAAPPEVVVQPGDTLWSIAEAIAPDVDVRITVDRLVQLNGNRPIAVGERLAIPA